MAKTFGFNSPYNDAVFDPEGTQDVDYVESTEFEKE